MKVFRTLGLMCVFAGILVAGASGNVINWGGGTGNWNVATNWSGGLLPTAGDTAVIASGTPAINATLTPAPDFVRVDPNGNANFTASNTNNWVLNGGTLSMTGDSNPNVSGPIQLTADSTIKNIRGNGSRTFTLSGVISEDGTPRSLTFSGNTTDNTAVSNTNLYTGGTIITGQVRMTNGGALGSGPVTINGGTLRLAYSGAYTCGPVTLTSGSVFVAVNNSTLKNLNLDLQGGSFWFSPGGNASATFDNSNTISISNTVSIYTSGGYYNGPFNIGASITGTGKAILMDTGATSAQRMQFAATQQWTGGTDVKGVTIMLANQTWGSSTGGILPAGTVTVYPVSHPYGNAVLNLTNTVAGSNGGLSTGTDLVLSHSGTVYGNVYLTTTVIVHSLTIDGVVIPAGFYTAASYPNFIVGTGTIRVMTPDAGPAAITNLAGTSPDWFKVNLTWTAPTDNIDPKVTSYDIRYSTAPIDSSNWDSATRVSGYPTPVAPGSTQTFDVGGLLGGTPYYFAVKSADSGMNWSDLSNVAMVITVPTDSVPPAAVSNLAVGDIRPSRVTLNWTATGDDDMTGTASGYDLRYSTAAIVTDADFAAATPVAGLAAPKAPGGAESAVVTGLTPSTTYFFAIKVKDEASNWSALSNVPSATTKEIDLDPPFAVTDLHVVGLASASVTLAWTAPADQGTAGTDSYDLRYSTSPITSDAEFSAAAAVAGLPVPAAAGTVQQFAIGNLQSSTTHYFAIKTADMADPANVSAISNLVSGMTRPPVVPVVVHNPWLSNDRVADTHNINTMAATYVNAYTPNGVVPPASNQDKAINIYNNQKRRLYHWADEPPNVGGNSIDDPTYNQNVFGWALCGRHACQGCTIASAAGLGTRKISVPGDWQMEFYYDGGWHLFHSMITFYVFTRGTNSHIAGADEIQADNNLVLNAVAENRACPGFLLCGDTAAWEADAINHYAANGGTGVVPTRWTGNMDLRLGQSFKRTWEAWQNQRPTPSTNSDPMPGADEPYHHEVQNDWKDYVNFPYWEPYGQVISYIHTSKTTYRRWSNGTDTLAPDFRSAGYPALLESTSNNIATFFQDGITPDLHASANNTQGEAVFKINVPYYITDASFSGDFVKATSSDVCKVYFSSNGTTWTQVYDAPVGTTHVTNQPLRTNVFGLWTTWYIKVQMKGVASKANAGVSNFVVTTIFEHNKGAMAYLDKGTNNITLTFDNAAELQASGNVVHVVYNWKEYDGSGWTIAKQYEGYFTASPSTFTIIAGGNKVPRTESVVMEVIPLPYDPVAPGQVAGLAAGTAKSASVPLTWVATGDDGNTGTAMAYDLRYSTSAITDDASFNAATQATGVPSPKSAGSTETFTVLYLQSDTTYYFAVKAIDKGGNRGPLSDVVTATTTSRAAVSDLAAGAPTSAKVTLNWTAIDDGSLGTYASYDLRCGTTPITDDASFNAATQVTGLSAPKAPGQVETFTVTYLNPSTTYYFAIKGIDAKGNRSPLSNVVSPTTAAAPFVSNLATGAPGSSRMPLTWTAIDDGVIGTCTSYNLRYSTSPITDDASFNAATAVTGVPAPKAAGQAESFTVTGLAGNTTYYFAIKAIDARGRSSPLSNVVSATTIVDTVPPQWIGNLKGQPSHTAHGVDLTWTAPEDYVDNGTGPYACAAYDLRYSTSPIAYDDGGASWNAATPVTGLPAPKAPGQTETFTVTLPTGGDTYYFAIKVADDASPANISEVSNCAAVKSSVGGDTVLQNGTNGYTGCLDSYLLQNSTTAYGTNDRMIVCGYGNGNYQRGILEFDLSSLAGMNITSAKLYLYSYNASQTKGTSGDYGLYPVTSDWTDTQCTWYLAKTGANWVAAGGDLDATADALSPKQSSGGAPVANVWYGWDVTSRVQSWLAGTSTNYGWIVRCTDESKSNQDYFYQSSFATASLRPKLVVSDLVAPVPGDISGDSSVDVEDLLYFVDSFGALCGTDRVYNPLCDFNSDGTIDVIDLLTFVQEYWPQ